MPEPSQGLSDEIQVALVRPAVAGFSFVSFVGSRFAKQVLLRFFYGNTSHSIVKLDACQFHLFIMVLSIFDSCATCTICRVWRTTCRMPHRRQKLRLFDAFLHDVETLEDRLKIGNESTHGVGRLLKGRTPSLSARARGLPVRCQLSVQVVDILLSFS